MWTHTLTLANPSQKTCIAIYLRLIFTFVSGSHRPFLALTHANFSRFSLFLPLSFPLIMFLLFLTSLFYQLLLFPYFLSASLPTPFSYFECCCVQQVLSRYLFWAPYFFSYLPPHHPLSLPSSSVLLLYRWLPPCSLSIAHTPSIKLPYFLTNSRGHLIHLSPLFPPFSP